MFFSFQCLNVSAAFSCSCFTQHNVSRSRKKKIIQSIVHLKMLNLLLGSDMAAICSQIPLSEKFLHSLFSIIFIQTSSGEQPLKNLHLRINLSLFDSINHDTEWHSDSNVATQHTFLLHFLFHSLGWHHLERLCPLTQHIFGHHLLFPLLSRSPPCWVLPSVQLFLRQHFDQKSPHSSVQTEEIHVKYFQFTSDYVYSIILIYLKYGWVGRRESHGPSQFYCVFSVRL